MSATREPRREYMVRLIRVVFDWLLKSNAADSFDIFESKIDGEFHGWSGNTLFALANGQIWQQTSYALTRQYAYSPNVVIPELCMEMPLELPLNRVTTPEPKFPRRMWCCKRFITASLQSVHNFLCTCDVREPLTALQAILLCGLERLSDVYLFARDTSNFTFVAASRILGGRER